MKRLVYILIPFLFLLSSCAKEEIPSDKRNFIGDWEPKSKDPEAIYILQINEDGTGFYSVTKPGSKLEVKGNVYFRGDNEFTIGGKIIKKKIKEDKRPFKIVESITPYKFHFEATFNGTEYKR